MEFDELMSRMNGYKNVTQKRLNKFQDPNFGDYKLIKSQALNTISYLNISDINNAKVGQDVWIRARLHNGKVKGNVGFLILRQSTSTIQTVIEKSESISKQVLKYCEGITNESIVDVFGKVKSAQVKSCSQGDVEVKIEKLFVVSRSEARLPFELDDAQRQVLTIEEEEESYKEVAEVLPQKEEKKQKDKKESKEAKEAKDQKGEKKNIKVRQQTRLDNRVIDLRIPTNQAIFTVQSGVCNLFRTFMLNQNFVEIHSPKLIAGTSEGGSEVFKTSYFGQSACLAQSPQLYKQMAIMADFPGVFEIGPVFRAERSFSNRHLCEFTGLDIEMQIKSHYFEVLDLLENMFNFIFQGIKDQFQNQINVITSQYPFITPFRWNPCVRIRFQDAVQMLQEAGFFQDPFKDLETENEKALGEIVSKKYNSDFFIVYEYPNSARPFYTMPCHSNPKYTCSYDIFMRGQEITSGAQRVHDSALLEKRIKEQNIDPNTLKDYIQAFSYGAYPHGGCGIGLERVVMLFLGLRNIRKTTLFPRDPKRLTP